MFTTYLYLNTDFVILYRFLPSYNSGAWQREHVYVCEGVKYEQGEMRKQKSVLKPIVRSIIDYRRLFNATSGVMMSKRSIGCLLFMTACNTNRRVCLVCSAIFNIDGCSAR